MRVIYHINNAIYNVFRGVTMRVIYHINNAIYYVAQ